jgi:hypothetical protein
LCESEKNGESIILFTVLLCVLIAGKYLILFKVMKVSGTYYKNYRIASYSDIKKASAIIAEALRTISNNIIVLLF